jgi:hypothetical protein
MGVFVHFIESDFSDTDFGREEGEARGFSEGGQGARGAHRGITRDWRPPQIPRKINLTFFKKILDKPKKA